MLLPAALAILLLLCRGPLVRLCSRSRAAGGQLQPRCRCCTLSIAAQQGPLLLCCCTFGALAAAAAAAVPAKAAHLSQQLEVSLRLWRRQRHNAAQRCCRKQCLAAQGNPAQGLQAGGSAALLLPRRGVPAQHSSAAQHFQHCGTAGQQGVDPHS